MHEGCAGFIAVGLAKERATEAQAFHAVLEIPIRLWSATDSAVGAADLKPARRWEKVSGPVG